MENDGCVDVDGDAAVVDGGACKLQRRRHRRRRCTWCYIIIINLIEIE